MVVPTGHPTSAISTMRPFSTTARTPDRLSFVFVIISTRETAAILGRASPRKPNEAISYRSSKSSILLVANRSKAKGTSSRGMPCPLSSIRTPAQPPFSNDIRTAVAPASREFSSSSLTMEAGRSMTSPAAIFRVNSLGQEMYLAFHGSLSGTRAGILYFSAPASCHPYLK